ncbi:MAG: hypothetical protein NWF04_01905 [Candidatus Bathyarchaeota archaeon]|nr:hypothetical protein [Candidatus Bathyarchaeota archaeon]
MKNTQENINIKKYLEMRIRGWLPQEPAVSKAQPSKSRWSWMHREVAEWEKTAYKYAAVANTGIGLAFRVSDTVFDLHTSSAEVAVAAWSAFIASLIVANVVLYRHFKKRARRGEKP